ncbi:MAG: pectin acetylesterase-family hydrolase [Kofleriaceae bacterium]
MSSAVTRTCSFLAIGGLSILSGCAADEPLPNPPRDRYGVWERIEPPGAVCGNGSQYKFFANFSETSDDLVVVLEPGGACWDYPSCTGASGIRGAANPDGIPDDHFELAPFISPFLQPDDATSPTNGWNMVYVPYCTGDIHSGNNVITYTDPEGLGPDVEFHHAGHDNVAAVIDWIDDAFVRVPRMLVTGCSAGGAGALANYHAFRQGIAAAERGYLFDDSGPIFPSTGFSAPLHAKIRASWAIDSLAYQFPDGFDPENFGSISAALATTYPRDRLATSFFQRDQNFSLYSYERFYEPTPTKDEILTMWAADTDLMVDQYDAHANLDYYLPYWRELNDSHCTTVVTFAGSEIQDQGLRLDHWLDDFLADREVPSAREAPVPGEDE